MSMASWRKIGFFSCAGAAAAIWCAAVPLYASTSDGATPSAVAPNQSVSITEIDTSADVLPKHDVPNELAATEESLARDAVEPNEPVARPHTTMMRRRGTSRQASSDSIPTGLAVPWYRSGLVSLAVVLGVVAGVYWLTRKFVPAFRASDSSIVRVVARSALSPKHNVALLRIGRRFVLVGVSGDRMNTLSEITDAEEVAELVAKVGGGSGSTAGAFEKMMTREADAFDVDFDGGAADEEAGPMVPSRRAGLHGGALSQLKDRLRGLQKER